LTKDQFIATFKMDQKAAPYDAIPKVTFTDSITFHLNGETVQAFHVNNAHTDGDVIIHFKESNVFHTGDVFVRYGLPFIDQPNGGSIDGMIKATDQLLATTNEQSKIIPGHGAISNKKDLMDYRNMLQTVRKRVAGGIKKGKTLQQIIDSDPAKEFTAVFERSLFVQSVYDSLKK
jgi:cyclase